MVRYLYDDDDEEEIWDYYDDEPYPEFIIGINEEKLLELFEKARAAGSSHEHKPASGCAVKKTK